MKAGPSSIIFMIPVNQTGSPGLLSLEKPYLEQGKEAGNSIWFDISTGLRDTMVAADAG